MRKTHKYLSLLALGVALMAGVSSCTKNTVDPNPSTPPQKSITEIVATDKNFSILLAAVTRANLTGALSAAGPLTLFAPNNDAFKAVGLDSATVAKTDATVLANILRYHVVGSAVKSSDVKSGINNTVTTLNGTAYASNFVYGTSSANTPVSYGLSVNGSRVTLADITATNGIVHIVDAVINPATSNIVATLQANPSFTLLVQAVVKANLAATLSGTGPFTVLAPTNEAFADAGINASFIDNASASTLADILKYHVFAGRNFTTNYAPTSLGIQGTLAPASATFPTLLELDRNSILDYAFDGGLKVIDNKQRISDNPKAASFKSTGFSVRPNMGATNGVIHAIDRVLLPADQNIVQILQSIPRFSLLVTAASRAGLVGTLSGSNPLTVFAPTNDAFIAFLGINPKLTVTVDVGGVSTEVSRDKTGAEILAEATNAINALNPAVLSSVLTYHVAASRLFSNNLAKGDLTMVSGGKAAITLDGGAKITGKNNIKDGKPQPSNLTKINLGATNGIIHVIDLVLKP